MSDKVNNLGDEENDTSEAGNNDIPEISLYEAAEGCSEVENNMDILSQRTDASITNLHQNITPKYNVGSNTSGESESVITVSHLSAVMGQKITFHAADSTSKEGKNSFDTETTSSARLNIDPEISTKALEVDNDVSICEEECQEMDLEFPLYLEELKNEIMQKVITMSSVRALDSGRDLSEIICRICYDDSDDVSHPAMTMCNCRGSVGLVHVHCLEKWLNQKTTDTCELCQHKFNTKFQATEPSIIRSMLKFIFLTDRSRTFVAPSCFLFIAQALTVTFLLVSFHLFALSFVSLLLTQPQQESLYSRYTSNVCVLLLIILINWLYSTLLIRETLTQYWIWYHWWLKTFTVKLILSKNTTE